MGRESQHIVRNDQLHTKEGEKEGQKIDVRHTEVNKSTSKVAIGGNDFKCKQNKHFNQSRYINAYYRGMEKCPSGQEHFLLLERTQI